ncbi:MAG TPA: response regulator [Blastocatellia bacterium]|nr:response regulator [Blastocatellia bacterium]
MQGSRDRILFVDDDDDTRQMMTVLLEQSGRKVTTAATAAEALSVAAKHGFDLYILDNLLPDGSGVDLCRYLRKLSPLVPVLFFSGAAYASDIEEATEAGAAGYIVKPADMEQVEATVARLLKSETEAVKVESTATVLVRHHMAEKSKYGGRDAAHRNS